MIGILMLAAAFGSASEININMTPIGPTIGPDADYAAISGTIKIDDVSRMLNATLTFNYGASSLNTAFTDRGVNLKPGDLLFYVGTLEFGIPIADHENLPGNTNGVTLHAGRLYENQQFMGQTMDHFQTAKNILNLNPISWPYRPDNPVWLGNAPDYIGIGTLTEMSTSQAITINGVHGYQYTVTLSGALPQAFVTDVDQATMDGTFSAYFAASTCANGVLAGSPPPPQVPEPPSVLLVTAAVAVAGCVWRNRFHRARSARTGAGSDSFGAGFGNER